MRRLALFGALALLVACNQIAGIEAPVDEPPAVAPTGAAAFVGRWRSDHPPTRDHLTGCSVNSDGVAFNGAYTFDLVDLGEGKVKGTNVDNPACQLTMSTSASVGTLVSAPACTFSGGLRITYTSATFTLSTPGVGVLELAGDAVLSRDTCKYEGKFTLRRD